MNSFGSFLVLFAWVLSVAGIVLSFHAARTEKKSWLGSAANATLACAATAVLATIVLGFLFANDDYTNQYVWQFSNKAMHPLYKVSAIWGGMDGSMLLWAAILAVSGGLVAARAFLYPRKLIPWVLLVLNTSNLFFLTVVVFLTNPFRHLKAPFIPPDGNGLNPLLQNPYMVAHPPMLYLGFTALSVPFAFCMGALLAGTLSNEWIRLTRRWTLLAWLFLTIGIVLGGYWAYIELGWGGFWAWDPVENASFMPWLTATAFLHSVMVQERKGMLKFWNVWLIVLTYGLTVFGTFLTRSGIVQSVHAFAATDVGWVFLVYLGAIFLTAAILTFYRRKELRSPRKIESLFSREAAFLMNNLVFLSICFATLWGVMFPVFSEALTGKKQAVSIPFFNAVNVPLFLLMLFLMGVGPLVAWRKASFVSILKTFTKPFLGGLVVALLLLWGGIHSFYTLLSYGLCAFVLFTLLGEFHRGIAVQRAAAGEGGESIGKSTGKLLRRHRSRYAGYLVHLGVLVAAIGITASMAHKVEKEFSLAVNEQYAVGRFLLELQGIEQRTNPNFDAVHAVVDVKSLGEGEYLSTLEPELRFYKRNGETTTEVAIRKSLREDLYLIVAGLDGQGQRAAMKVFINPLQAWLWIGTFIIVIGTLASLWPTARKAAQKVPAKSNAIAAK